MEPKWNRNRKRKNPNNDTNLFPSGDKPRRACASGADQRAARHGLRHLQHPQVILPYLPFESLHTQTLQIYTTSQADDVKSLKFF